MSHLIKCVSTSLLVHFSPGLLFEDTGSWGNLCDDVKGVLLHVLGDHVERTRWNVIVISVLWLLAVGVHIPEGLAEVAVLVVEEEEIDDVVWGILGVFHGECPEIVVGSVHDTIEVLETTRPQNLASLCQRRIPTEAVISPTFHRTHSLHEPSSPTTFIQPKSYTNRPPSVPHEKVSFFNSIVSSSWLPSFISGGSSGNSSAAFPALSSKQKMSFLKKNFANNCPDYNIDMEMHRFGDTGRISNRYQEDRWDVW